MLWIFLVISGLVHTATCHSRIDMPCALAVVDGHLRRRPLIIPLSSASLRTDRRSCSTDHVDGDTRYLSHFNYLLFGESIGNPVVQQPHPFWLSTVLLSAVCCVQKMRTDPLRVSVGNGPSPQSPLPSFAPSRSPTVERASMTFLVCHLVSESVWQCLQGRRTAKPMCRSVYLLRSLCIY
ncbi:hypothetical protein F5146DRAFT_252453 [Armillaria mellea]|nr:hypothetical protein F5146DRAFT_252453 [Armillaria mellea]